jgi:hypothetical protein
MAMWNIRKKASSLRASFYTQRAKPLPGLREHSGKELVYTDMHNCSTDRNNQHES